MRTQVAACADVTLEDYCELWAEAQGVQVSVATMSRDQHGFGITVKNSVYASERDETERASWRAEVADLGPAELVFVDESGTNLSMTPRYGRIPLVQRMVRGRPPRITAPT